MVKTTPSKKKHFNSTLKAKDDPVKAVCYSPNKHSELKTVTKTKSPIQLQNFKLFVITKFTMSIPFNHSDIFVQGTKPDWEVCSVHGRSSVCI